MINVMVALSAHMFGSFGLTIIVLTIIIRGIMSPLSVKQLRSSRAMQELQPKIAELQKKYAKDKQKLAEEQMKLYKQSGVSPAGCAIPMLIQFPIWIALYQSIVKALGTTPEDLLGLSRYLWSWDVLYTTLPLNNHFLWFNLVSPDIPTAILVGVTMWLSQKMITPNVTDPQQKAQSQMTLWMMPILFGFIAMSLPSGLGLYWIVSNIFSIVMQFFFLGGWGGLSRSGATRTQAGGKELRRRISQVEESQARITAGSADVIDESSSRRGVILDEGEYGVKRQLRGGGHQQSLKSIRRHSGPGKGHGS
jgi:YidC/Oxa1 family membrane protein insertase